MRRFTLYPVVESPFRRMYCQFTLVIIVMGLSVSGQCGIPSADLLVSMVSLPFQEEMKIAVRQCIKTVWKGSLGNDSSCTVVPLDSSQLGRFGIR